MSEWLFEQQRIHPAIYDVMIQGVEERTVSIRGGIAWPGVENQGYIILVAQLERKGPDGNNRFLAFYEDQARLNSDFFEKIGIACRRWRVDSLSCGGARRVMSMGGHIKPPSGEIPFTDQLLDFLIKKERRYDIVQLPSVGPSWRSTEPDFLVSLVRNQIANRSLLLFQSEDNRTPLLIDRIRNTDMESNILEVPELKALAHVMDDFDAGPWRSPMEDARGNY